MDKETVLAAIEAIHIRAYVARGRILADIAPDILASMWVERYKAWVAAPGPATSTAEEDARAELLIRGLPLPKEQVAADQAAYLAANQHRRPSTVEDLANDPALGRVVDKILNEIDRRQ
jgi:hypothetical protein